MGKHNVSKVRTYDQPTPQQCPYCASRVYATYTAMTHRLTEIWCESCSFQQTNKRPRQAFHPTSCPKCSRELIEAPTPGDPNTIRQICPTHGHVRSYDHRTGKPTASNIPP